MLFFDDISLPAKNTPIGADKKPECFETGGGTDVRVFCFVQVLSNLGWTRKTLVWRTFQTSVRPVRRLLEKHFPAWARARNSSKNNLDGLDKLTKTSQAKDFKRPTRTGRTPDAWFMAGRIFMRTTPPPPRGKKGKKWDSQTNMRIFSTFFTASGSIVSTSGSGGRTALLSSGTCNLSIRKVSKRLSRFSGPKMSGEAMCISDRHNRNPGR